MARSLKKGPFVSISLEKKVLKNIEDNITLIVEVFKHQDYYKKYVDIKSFAMKVNEVEEYIGGLV